MINLKREKPPKLTLRCSWAPLYITKEQHGKIDKLSFPSISGYWDKIINYNLNFIILACLYCLLLASVLVTCLAVIKYLDISNLKKKDLFCSDYRWCRQWQICGDQVTTFGGLFWPSLYGDQCQVASLEHNRQIFHNETSHQCSDNKIIRNITQVKYCFPFRL